MLLLCVLSGVLLALVIVLLIVSARRSHAERETARRIGDELEDGLRAMEDELARRGAEQREELLRAFQDVNEGLAVAMERGAQRQTQQLGAFQQQSYESERGAEARQQNLHRKTDYSLGKFEKRMESIQITLDQKLLLNDNRLERMRETLEAGMKSIQSENAQKLEEMRKTVDEKLHDTLDQRLTQSFAQVSERLEQVYKSLGEVHSLAQGVGDLKRVLSNVKTRGIWGEIQLGSLLEQALAPSQYEANVAVKPGSAERVEYAIRLPGKENGQPVYLAVDSKFPQEDYARLVEASERGDAAATELARKALAASIRAEGKRIGKYIEPPYTADFAIMFLPLESLYAEVVREAESVERLQRELRVVVAGPSTLLALLNSLQMGFRTIAIERRSAEVWRLLGAVKTDFGNFSTVLKHTQEKLRQASDSIDTAFVRTRSIERKLRRVEALDERETTVLLDDPEEAPALPGADEQTENS